MNNQHRALIFMSDKPGVTSSDLAAHLECTTKDASSLISRLVRKGHITKQHSPRSNLIMVYTITDAGRAAMRPTETVRDRIAQFLSANPNSSTGQIAEGVGERSGVISTTCDRMKNDLQIMCINPGSGRRKWALTSNGATKAAGKVILAKRKPEPPRCPMMRAMPPGSALEQHYRQGMVDVRPMRKRALRAITGGLGRAA